MVEWHRIEGDGINTITFTGAGEACIISNSSINMAAEEKAKQLFKSWLSPSQLASYEKDGYIDIVGCHTKRYYRIYYSGLLREVTRAGLYITEYCLSPSVYLPIYDLLLSKKLALEIDETNTLRIANQLGRCFKLRRFFRHFL